MNVSQNIKMLSKIGPLPEKATDLQPFIFPIPLLRKRGSQEKNYNQKYIARQS